MNILGKLLKEYNSSVGVILYPSGFAGLIFFLIGALLALFGLFAFAMDGSGVGLLVFGVLMLLIGVLLIASQCSKYRQAEEKRAVENAKYMEDSQKHNEEIIAWKKSEYSSLLKKHSIFSDAKTVTEKGAISRYNRFYDIKKYIFITDNSLCLYPVYDEYRGFEASGKHGSELQSDIKSFFYLTRIPIDNIEHFRLGGEIYREQRISGGGGGGSDIGGAILGGLIAGEAGAVIGSRKETEAIKSETVTHDTREVVLSYFEDGIRKTIMFKHENYQVFEDMMPEKNLNIVSEVKKHAFIQQSTKVDETKVIIEQIKELAKLRDDGILTDEEFKVKKTELLAKM